MGIALLNKRENKLMLQVNVTSPAVKDFRFQNFAGSIAPLRKCYQNIFDTKLYRTFIDRCIFL